MLRFEKNLLGECRRGQDIGLLPPILRREDRIANNNPKRQNARLDCCPEHIAFIRITFQILYMRIDSNKCLQFHILIYNKTVNQFLKKRERVNP